MRPTRHTYCSVVAGITSLQSHLERLLLLVMLRDMHAAGGSAQGTQGAAFLAMLFSLGWAVSPPCYSSPVAFCSWSCLQGQPALMAYPCLIENPSGAVPRAARAGAAAGHGLSSHLLGPSLP